MTILFLLIALCIILVSAELFTNGVEWFGRRYEMGEGAVGSILAAVGTAMPETLVPIIAILFTSGASAHEIGVGAILGAPFMLSSLAMFVTGVAIVIFAFRGRRTRDVRVNEPVMRRDLSHFLIAYSLAMIAGLIHIHHIKWVLAPLLLVFYGHYVWQTMRSEGDIGGDLKPLYFHRHPVMPHRRRIFLQLLVSLAGIVLGAELFVKVVQRLSTTLGASALVVSLLITPIATELPEKFNSILWMRSR